MNIFLITIQKENQELGYTILAKKKFIEELNHY